MQSEERMRLIRTLIKASNSFHKELEEAGYIVEYDINSKETGYIYDAKTVGDPRDAYPVGVIKLGWEIKK